MKSSIRLAALATALLLAGCGEVYEPTRPGTERARPLFTEGDSIKVPSDSTTVPSDSTNDGGTLVGGN